MPSLFYFRVQHTIFAATTTAMVGTSAASDDFGNFNGFGQFRRFRQQQADDASLQAAQKRNSELEGGIAEPPPAGGNQQITRGSWW